MNLENNHLGWKDCDWEVPPVAEETIDRIATMMTIYPRYTYNRNLNTICNGMVVGTGPLACLSLFITFHKDFILEL